MRASVALLLGAALIGCSGGRLAEDEYSKAVESIGRQAKSDMEEFARTDDLPDPALGPERAFALMDAKIDRAIGGAKIAWKGMEDLRSPKKYDGLHAAMVALYRSNHDSLLQLKAHYRGPAAKLTEVQAAIGAEAKAKSLLVAEEVKKLGTDISEELRQFSYMQ